MKAKWNVVEKPVKDDKVNKPISNEEAIELIKLIYYNNYSMVDQLNKTPCQISLLSLILCLKPYKKAFYKVLIETYVLEDIISDTIKHMVESI
jgi:hypothetical protein